MHIMSIEPDSALTLAAAIRDCVENVRHCSNCNLLTESDPCAFCSDPLRDGSLLCLVANTQDAFLVEETHEYHGRYFVLGNLLSPLDGIGPDDIHLPQLLAFLADNPVKEVILALNPSAEGETTMNFLADQLRNRVERVTRLSTGLPFGGDIEYTTATTLGNAFKRRYPVRG